MVATQACVYPKFTGLGQIWRSESVENANDAVAKHIWLTVEIDEEYGGEKVLGGPPGSVSWALLQGHREIDRPWRVSDLWISWTLAEYSGAQLQYYTAVTRDI